MPKSKKNDDTQGVGQSKLPESYIIAAASFAPFQTRTQDYSSTDTSHLHSPKARVKSRLSPYEAQPLTPPPYLFSGTSSLKPDDCEQKPLSVTPEPDMTISSPEKSSKAQQRSMIFALSSKQQAQDSSIELTCGDKTIKKYYLLKTLKEDRVALEKAHPLVAKKFLQTQPTNGEVKLGKGTFSSVFLAKDEQGRFYAGRTVSCKEELPSDLLGDDARIGRAKIVLDTLSEIGIHSHLKKHGLEGYILLIEHAALIKMPEGYQIYQFLPLADLGNGLEVSYKMTYLKKEDKKTLFKHIVFQLVLATIKLHEAKVAINDVKPENILVQSSGHVSLSDFGASCYIDDKNKLKQTSSLKDKRYLAPYSDKALSIGAKQRCDLWSLALSIIEFWEPSIVQDFIKEAVPRRYSPLIPEPVQSPSFFKTVSSNYYSETPLEDSTNTAAQKTSFPKGDQIIFIYKQEVTKHILLSSAFAQLPPKCRLLLEKMLSMEDLNQPSKLINLVKLVSGNTASKVEFKDIPGILAYILEMPDAQINDNTVVLDILNQFLTLPDTAFNQDLYDYIKKQITAVAVCFPETKPIQEAFNNSHPSCLATIVSPIIKRIKESLPSKESSVSNNLTDLEVFLEILSNLCQGAISYQVALTRLNQLSKDMNKENDTFSIKGLAPY